MASYPSSSDCKLISQDTLQSDITVNWMNDLIFVQQLYEKMDD